jgi:hypothetical protein
MKNKNKVLTALEEDIKLNSSFDDKLVVYISALYRNRLLVTESENKVMLDKLISATQGKELILELNSRK